MEKGIQYSDKIKRSVRAEKLRDYFDLQLCFAEVVAQAAAIPLSKAIRQYTNFYRRFGLGHLNATAVSPRWDEYVEKLMLFKTHDQRLDWTQAFFEQSPEERLPIEQRSSGCFSCDPPDDMGRVKIHFGNRDDDGIGPLNRIKMDRRRQELKEMFAFVKKTFGTAESVIGRSWLYHRESYRRLFPPVYGDSREVIQGTARFQGSGYWGQFLDHQECVAPQLREKFLINLNHLDMRRLWEVFPLPAYRTQAPIKIFYDFYHIHPAI